MTLKEDEHVTTESRGEGLRRRVVIIPKVKAVAAVAAEAGTEGAVLPEGEPGNQALPYSPEAMAVEDSVGNVVPPEPSEDEDDFGNR